MAENKKALENEDCTTIDIISQNNGFVKLFRNILDWEWYTEPNVMRLFIHCLIKANHASKKWRGVTIHAGSFITSYSKLAQDLKLSERNIRTSLKHLKSTGEVTLETTRQYSIISINNWNSYQQYDTRLDTRVTYDRHTSDTRVTTNNNDNNDNNEKNINNNILRQDKKFKKPTLEEIQSYCLERKNNVDAQRFFDYYSANGWKVGKNPMKDFKAAIRTWENNQNKYNNTNTEEIDGWSI